MSNTIRFGISQTKYRVKNTYILKDIFMVITHAVKMFRKSIVSRNIPPAMIQKRK